VVESLRRRREFQRLERAAADREWSSEWASERLVFTTVAGTPIDASNLRRYVRRACEAAGIGRWTPYEMRHSAASLLSAKGVPLERVADVLRHDGTRMVAQVYRHAVAPTVDVAAVPMQRLLGADQVATAPRRLPIGSPGRARRRRNGTDQGGCPGQVGGP
jgi:integrase